MLVGAHNSSRPCENSMRRSLRPHGERNFAIFFCSARPQAAKFGPRLMRRGVFARSARFLHQRFKRKGRGFRDKRQVYGAAYGQHTLPVSSASNSGRDQSGPDGRKSGAHPLSRVGRIFCSSGRGPAHCSGALCRRRDACSRPPPRAGGLPAPPTSRRTAVRRHDCGQPRCGWPGVGRLLMTRPSAALGN
jgi:hypothetical protein